VNVLVVEYHAVTCMD